LLTKSRFGSHGCIPIAEDLAGRRRRHCLDDVGDLRPGHEPSRHLRHRRDGRTNLVERGALVVSDGMASHPRAPSALGPSRRIPAARSQQRFEPSDRFHTESRPEGVPGADRVPYGPLFGVLKVSGIIEGAAFRPVDCHGHIGTTRLSAQAVALVLKRHAARAGLDPADMAGHSLRAGLATSAAAAGVPERVIAEQIGHKGTAMLRRYIREGSLFRENAASAVGL
jgi:hypothetical protein